MIGAVILAIAVAAIAWSASYEHRLGTRDRADRAFARRSRADLTRHDTRAPRFDRDPSPRRRAS